jgi:hypothetical protein
VCSSDLPLGSPTPFYFAAVYMSEVLYIGRGSLEKSLANMEKELEDIKKTLEGLSTQQSPLPKQTLIEEIDAVENSIRKLRTEIEWKDNQ